MVMSNMCPVVVGYDATPSSRAALLVAAGEAVRRDRNLLIVHVEDADWDPVHAHGGRDPLAEAVELVQPVIAPNRVSALDRSGPAASVLCELAEHAELLVVGRGEVGLLARIAGSVAVDVACHAPCPVLIVGDAAREAPRNGPVVAGVDREHAHVVLDAAFREADLRRTQLVVIHGWNGVRGAGPDGLTTDADAEVAGEHHVQWLHDVVAPFQSKYPAVAVTELPREGHAARLLTTVSAGAGLIVVGTRGRGPVAGMFLGSVGQKLLRRARCPVRRAGGARSSAPTALPCGHRDHSGAVARHSCRGLLRHGVPREHAAGRGDLSDSARVAGEVGPAALRLSRAVLRPRRAAWTARGRVEPRPVPERGVPPGGRRLPVRRAGRPLRRHHDGFTPLDGLVMATRCGALDPGLLLWLQENGGLSERQIAGALEHRSGLLALAGSGDLRDVFAGVANGDERCRVALEVYVHRLVAGIAAMAAALGGMDVLTFTGGVGENSVELRRTAADRLSFLGVALDRQRNEEVDGDADLSTPAAAVRTVVVRAREDLVIADGVRTATHLMSSN